MHWPWPDRHQETPQVPQTPRAGGWLSRGWLSRGGACPTPTYKPETDWRRSVEGGLRTGLATLLSLVWSQYGPLPPALRAYGFFNPVVAIVVYRTSFGETISESLGALQGGLFGVAITTLFRAICGTNSVAVGFGVFFSIFFIVRARRLSSLARKLGCTIVLMGLLSFRTAQWPRVWFMKIASFYWTFFEGAFFALLANAIPYPRIALREGALRAQYSSQVMSACVFACVLSFLRCRDERALAEAALLSEQLKKSISRHQAMRRWMELELLVFSAGWWRPQVMGATDAIARLVAVEVQALECLTGMRQALEGIGNTAEQHDFLEYLRDPMRVVAQAVSECCEDVAAQISLDELRRVIWRGCGCGGSGGASRGCAGDAAALPTALARLGEALEVLVDSYDLARVRLLYGVEDVSAFGASRDSPSAVPASPMPRSPAPAPASPLRPSREAPSPLDSPIRRPGTASAANNTPLKAAMAAAAAYHGDYAAASPRCRASSPLPASEAGPLSPKRRPAPEAGPLSPQRRPAHRVPDLPFRGSVANKMTDYRGYLSIAAFFFSLVNLCLTLGQLGLVEEALHGKMKEGESGGSGGGSSGVTGSGDDSSFGDGGGGLEDGGVAAAASFHRGSSPKKQVRTGPGQRFLQLAETRCRRVLRGAKRILTQTGKLLWRGVGPSPELEAVARSLWRRCRVWVAAKRRGTNATAEGSNRGAAGADGEVPTGGDLSMAGDASMADWWRYSLSLGRPDKHAAGLALWGREVGLQQRQRPKHGSWAKFVRWARRNHQELFHPLKLATTITVCCLFVLIPELNKEYAPALWVGFTAVFVMSNDSSSGFVTSSLRLVGTVFGSMYAYMTARLVGLNIGTFTWELLIIIPLWVSFCCCFRFGPSGYAPVVAAFTCVLLFIGAFTVSNAGDRAPFARMENTIIGILIYVLLDNIIAPVRAKSLLRQHIFTALRIFSMEVASLEVLLFEVTDTAEAEAGGRVASAAGSRAAGSGFVDTGAGSPGAHGGSETRHERAATMAATNSFIVFEPINTLATAQQTSSGSKNGAVTSAPGASTAVASPADDSASPGAGSGDKEGAAGGLAVAAAEQVAEGAGVAGWKVEGSVVEIEASVTSSTVVLPEGQEKTQLLQFESSQNKYLWQRAAAAGVAPAAAAAAAAAVASPASAGAAGGGASITRRGGSIFGSHHLSEALVGGWRSTGKLLPRVSERLATLSQALSSQASSLHWASLEPRLWHRPFHAASYQRLLAAQEEMHASLMLMAHATTAFRSICSIQTWRDELANISSIIIRLRALLRHIKEALADAKGAFAIYQLTDWEAAVFSEDSSRAGSSAGSGGGGSGSGGKNGTVAGPAAAQPKEQRNNQDVFGSPSSEDVREAAAPFDEEKDGEETGTTLRFGSITASVATSGGFAAVSMFTGGGGGAASGGGSIRGAEERMMQRTQQALHLLEIQVDARRLEKCVNNEWLRFVRQLVATGENRPLSLEFVIRFNTVVFSVQSLQRGLLALAHALLEVLERERFAYYYA